jgi:hypothetical protein
VTLGHADFAESWFSSTASPLGMEVVREMPGDRSKTGPKLYAHVRVLNRFGTSSAALLKKHEGVF